MSEPKSLYPRFIQGDPLLDFAEQNKFISILPEYKKLVGEHGAEKASKIMWSFYIIYDPTSFFFTRMSYLQRLRFVQAEYFPDFNDKEFGYLEKFYNEFIIINKDVLHYGMVNKKFEMDLETNSKYTATQAAKDKLAIKEFESLANNNINSGLFQIAGSQQGGIFAQTIKKYMGVEDILG